MAGKLSGQRALVTGASSGIGLELARQLGAMGAELVLVARREDRLNDLALELCRAHAIEVTVIPADLTDPSAPERLFAATEGSGQPIDILVNNAGFGAYDTFVDLPWSSQHGMLQLNIVALTHLTHLLAPAMVSRGRGRVINIASVGAYLPCPTFAVYAATKAYVRNFTEALNYELKGTGVTATSVCPGGTRTEFLDRAGQSMRKSGEKLMMSSARCAQIALTAGLSGRSNIVTGFSNAVAMWALRLLPRGMLAWVAHKALASSVEKVSDTKS